VGHDVELGAKGGAWGCGGELMSGSGDELRAELEATATIWWVAAVSSAMQRSSGCGHDLGPTFGNSHYADLRLGPA
jgi:hypothetical protein